MAERACGTCTACCKILPTKEISKPALTRCQHQRHGKGCAIYDHRPLSCRLWACMWLQGAEDLRRPDRGHYVVDPMPDYAIARNPGQPDVTIPLVQIWIDPAYPDAHRDPGLRAYLNKRGEEGFAAIIRYGSSEGFTIFPPSMSSDGEWHEMREQSSLENREHSVREVASVLGYLR